jgi:dTDP-glucose 4,6-dehydratase
MSTERIAVIGSNSFTGVHFINHCLEQGAEVLGINRSPEGSRIFLPHLDNDSKAYRFAQLDLNKDMTQILSEITDFQPEYVVNFAAQGMVGQSWQAPLDWFNTNTLAMVDLHDRLRKLKFLKRFLHSSTPEVYGSCSGLVPETAPFQPSTPYAVSKTACDMSLLTFHKVYDFPVVFTRSANVFGPSQQLFRIIPRSIIYFLTGRKLGLHGGGHSVRSFIHISDVVKGTLDILRRGTNGEVYHLATKRTISIRGLVEMIAEKLSVRFEDCVDVVGDRLGKDSAYLLDTTKVQEELGWEPTCTLEDGIDECIDWVKENLETINALPLEYVHKK